MTRRVRVSGGAAVCVLTVVLAAVAGVAVAWLSLPWLLAGAVLAAWLGFVVLGPVRLLPAFALVLFALVPFAYIPAVPPYLGRFLSPPVVVLAVWLFRTLTTSLWCWGVRQLLPVMSMMLGLVALSIFSIEVDRSLLWSVVFVLCVSVLGLQRSAEADRSAEVLRSTWIALGTGLGLVGVVEGIVGWNPLTPYLVAGDSTFAHLEAGWGVHRIITTIGHPLANGVFFAVTAVICFAWWVLGAGSRALVAAVVCGVALLYTAARGALAGAVLGAVVVLLVGRSHIRLASWRTAVLLVIAALGVIGGLQSPVLASRLASGDATSSDAYRETVFTMVWQLVTEREPWDASGPGTSQDFLTASGIAQTLESSVLQMFVSLGIVGALVVGVYFGGRWARAVVQKDVVMSGAMVCFVFGTAFFNAWDSNVAIFVVLALAAVAAQSRGDGNGAPTEQEISPEIALAPQS